MKTTPTRPILLALALAAVALPSFAAEPVNIARLAGTTKKVVSGSGEEGTGFSGGTKIDQLFDGNLKNCARLSYIGANGYIQLDFPEAYFVTSINVTKWYRHKYSLSISADGTNWTPVDYATTVNRYGTKSWGVYKATSFVRISFPEGSNNCEDVAELEVWGVPVSGMDCSHSSLSAWTSVPNSATCTKPTLERATCSACGEVFTRESNGLPAGHAYQAKVVTPGKGWFYCRRCNDRIDFSNGEMNLSSLSCMPYDETSVQFVAVSTSQFDIDEQWGSPNNRFVDDKIDTRWTGGSTTLNFAMKFAADVQLTKIEVTVSGANYAMWYYLKITDAATGATLLEPGRYLLDSGDEKVTKTFAFSNKTAKEINVSVYNNGGWRVWVDEVRVFGTVPGPVTPDPCYLLMQ